jgi:hypothetical protein
MITRDQALRGHSPALWALVAACAGEILLVVGWNAWEYRKQLLGRLKI